MNKNRISFGHGGVEVANYGLSQHLLFKSLHKTDLAFGELAAMSE